jgi:hypothetical protein
MRIHDTGPPTEVPYAGTKRTTWGYDHGTRGHVDRERPFIDDEPAHGPRWEARFPWESRPARDLERELGRWGPAPKGFLRRAWSRLRNLASR